MRDTKNQQLAIVGAGVSGLAAAWALRDSDWDVTVFEKSKGVSGRAASRLANGARYDHGANYFRTETPEVEDLVLRQLPTAGLIDISGDVWTFDRHGAMAPGDAKMNAEPKWNYRQGISTLGKYLAQASGARIVKSTRVALMEKQGSDWELFNDDEKSLGVFDAVLLTAPAPQVIEILAASEGMDEEECEEVVGLLDEVKYHAQFSLVLGVEGKVARPENCYALMNEDREHESIAWLSFEDGKSGRVPEGESVLIAQMTPKWTAEHYEDDVETLRDLAVEAVSSLLKLRELRLIWFDKQRWKYAHPYCAADADEVHEAAPEGLFFAGDAFVGKGRVGRSIETGLQAAELIMG